MRVFIAIELPASVRQDLESLPKTLLESLGQEAIQGFERSASLTRPESLHLTLNFIGEITRRDLEVIRDVMRAAAAIVGSFELTLAGLGAFPQAKDLQVQRLQVQSLKVQNLQGQNLQVLWIGLGGDLDCLAKLQVALRRGLVVAGFKQETRPYTPHITLVRAKRGRQIPAALWQLRELLVASSIPVRAIVLLQSRATEQGSVYSVLAKQELGPSPVS